ncbi:hypothetical protein OIY81_1115 [Cryptosporidium canis]|nr:hypothetical protein OIY81_1115 [Cryptosporidium canis]
MSRKHPILNNTRVIMNLFSFLEISDLIQMRNLNSCSKLISDHFIKVNINRDKSKNMNADGENNSTYIKNTQEFTSKSHNLNSTSQLRMKFLQLWNIYSNKSSIEKVNYYDSNLSLLVRILLYLISNVKKGLEYSFIPNNGLISISQDLDLDLDLDLDQGSGCDQLDFDNTPIYIQEFLRNEAIWKIIAKLSGYNLSNAELSSESDGIFEYYLWPEKIDDPKYSMIDQNIIENILSKMMRIRNLDPNIRKQVAILMNKNSKAELIFYSNSGNIVNKSKIHIIKNPLDSENHENNNCDFLRDIYHRDNSESPSDHLTASYINSQLSSTILLWILNFLKLQKQLPCLKQVPKSNNNKAHLNNGPFQHQQRNNHNILHNHNYNIKRIIPTLAPKASMSRFSRLLNNKNSQIQSEGLDNFSNSNLGDIPETFGKLCNIINSQENLLVELKQILNTIK